MNNKQKECLRANQDYFAENMVDVMKVCDHLLAKDDLTRNMVEEIRGNVIHTEKVRALLAKMPTRSNPRAFQNFYEALEKSGNKGLAEQMVPCLLADVPVAEDAIDAGDVAMADQAIGATSVEPNSGVSSSSQQIQHIMISYQSKNRRMMEDVRDGLKEHGYIVWMDVDDMTGDVNTAMADGVENSFAVLVAGSEKYLESVNCMKEIGYADRRKKPIIPLSMEPNFKASGKFAVITEGRVPIEFTRFIAFDESFKKLLKELEARKPRLDKN